MGESQWLMTKSMIETAAIEAFLEEHEAAPMEQVVIEATSTKWSDAVNAVTAIAALVGNKKINISMPTEKVDIPKYERSWEWMNSDDGKNIIRKRNARRVQSE
jgi:hypothetical protein